MKNLGSTLAKGLFYAFALTLLAYGVIREFDFMQFIAPGNLLLQAFGCIVFTGGMLVWMLLFFKGSSGLWQHAISLLSSIAGLLFTVGASAASIWLRQSLTDKPADFGQFAVWLVVGATAFNILMVWLFHVMDPSIMRDIMDHVREAQILEKADKLADTKAEEIADELAARIAEHRTANLVLQVESRTLGKRTEPDRVNGNSQREPHAEQLPKS